VEYKIEVKAELGIMVSTSTKAFQTYEEAFDWIVPSDPGGGLMMSGE